MRRCFPPITVFLSSPSDVEKHREALRNHLAKMAETEKTPRFKPKSMRGHPAADVDCLNECLEMVEQSQVYLGLIGADAGTIVKRRVSCGHCTSLLSETIPGTYTRHEFDRATEIKLYRIALVAKLPQGGKHIDMSEHLRDLRDKFEKFGWRTHFNQKQPITLTHEGMAALNFLYNRLDSCMALEIEGKHSDYECPDRLAEVRKGVAKDAGAERPSDVMLFPHSPNGNTTRFCCRLPEQARQRYLRKNVSELSGGVISAEETAIWCWDNKNYPPPSDLAPASPGRGPSVPFHSEVYKCAAWESWVDLIDFIRFASNLSEYGETHAAASAMLERYVAGRSWVGFSTDALRFASDLSEYRKGSLAASTMVKLHEAGRGWVGFSIDALRFVSDLSEYTSGGAAASTILKAGGYLLGTEQMEEAYQMDGKEHTGTHTGEAARGGITVDGRSVPVIAFFGTKGGVGKTTLIDKFALMVSRAESCPNVLLVDFDVHHRGLTVLRTRDDFGSCTTIHEYMASPDLSFTTALDVTPVSAGEGAGRQFLIPSSNMGAEKVFATLSRAKPQQLLARIQEVMTAAAAIYRAHIILIDCGPIVDPLTASAAHMSDMAFIIGQNEPISFQALHNYAQKIREFFPQFDAANVKVILNKVRGPIMQRQSIYAAVTLHDGGRGLLRGTAGRRRNQIDTAGCLRA